MASIDRFDNFGLARPKFHRKARTPRDAGHRRSERAAANDCYCCHG